MDAVGKRDKREGDRRWTECNGTSNSNMPAMSRGDALMRAATGGLKQEEEEEEKEEEERERRTAGVLCLLARRMKV